MGNSLNLWQGHRPQHTLPPPAKISTTENILPCHAEFNWNAGQAECLRGPGYSVVYLIIWSTSLSPNSRLPNCSTHCSSCASSSPSPFISIALNHCAYRAKETREYPNSCWASGYCCLLKVAPGSTASRDALSTRFATNPMEPFSISAAKLEQFSA